MRPAILIAAAAAAALAAPAWANDSTAVLPAGGLVLTKSSTIEMRSEDLYISEGQVRVSYSFVNTSPQPVTVTVAFPLPDVTTNGFDDNFDLPVDSSATNYVGFKTTVDGRPVAMQVEQKAFEGKVDETALLKSLRVPLAPWMQATQDALSRLPRAKQDELIKLQMAAPEDGNEAAPGVQMKMVAQWTLKTTFYWNQTFPPGLPVSVQHSYKPSVGSFVSTELEPLQAPADPDQVKARAQFMKDYCVDNDLISTILKTTPHARDSMPLYYDNYIDYVLTTGANWKAPIGDFKMTIDKGSASNLVSFCGTGVVKTGPTTFQVHYTNFTPTEDVKVLLLKPRPSS